MRTPSEVRASVRASIQALRRQAADAARDAKQYERGADETERDLADRNWNELARFGFISYSEAAMMSVQPNRRRTSGRKRRATVR